MIGKHRAPSAYPTAGSRSWPMLLMLLAVVLVPTLCVLWFMNEVAQNEHLAVRKKLTDVYRSQLPIVRDRLENGLRKNHAS
jgi:Cu/Ag efflux pump CusA